MAGAQQDEEGGGCTYAFIGMEATGGQAGLKKYIVLHKWRGGKNGESGSMAWGLST